jgi:hypothetical protein
LPELRTACSRPTRIIKEPAFSWASALSQVLESLQALLLDTCKILSGVKPLMDAHKRGCPWDKHPAVMSREKMQSAKCSMQNEKVG